jgi:hypothetical protein
VIVLMDEQSNAAAPRENGDGALPSGAGKATAADS